MPANPNNTPGPAPARTDANPILTRLNTYWQDYKDWPIAIQVFMAMGVFVGVGQLFDGPRRFTLDALVGNALMVIAMFAGLNWLAHRSFSFIHKQQDRVTDALGYSPPANFQRSMTPAIMRERAAMPRFWLHYNAAAFEQGGGWRKVIDGNPNLPAPPGETMKHFFQFARHRNRHHRWAVGTEPQQFYKLELWEIDPAIAANISRGPIRIESIRARSRETGEVASFDCQIGSEGSDWPQPAQDQPSSTFGGARPASAPSDMR